MPTAKTLAILFATWLCAPSGLASQLGAARARQLESPPTPPSAAPDASGFAPRPGAAPELPHMHLATGEFQTEATDMFVAGRGLDFALTRKYRSRRSTDSPVGVGWDHSYNIFVTARAANLVLHDGHTRRDLFQPQSGGTWVASEWIAVGLDQPGGGWDLVFPDGGRWAFLPLDGSPAAGRIDRIVDRNGNTIQCQYDGSGRLVRVLDTLARNYDFQYDPGGHLTSVTDFSGRTVIYEYYEATDTDGGAGDLKSVRSPIVSGTPTGNDFPDGRTVTYKYTRGFADERLNHNLISITDGKGQTYLSNAYATTEDPHELDFDRLVTMQLGAPGEDFELSYTPHSPNPANRLRSLTVEVVDRNGYVDQLDFDVFNRCIAVREYTAGLHTGEPASYETQHFWNADALPTRVIYPEGNDDEYVYQGTQPDCPARSRGNLLSVTMKPGPRGADQTELVQQFEYDDAGAGDAGHNFATREIDARGNATTHSYDSAGNRTRSEYAISGLVEDWQYNGFGQVSRYIHPDNGSGHLRVDDLGYYDSSAGVKEGYLASRTDDVNGFACTTLFDVDARGNVVTETDALANERITVYNALDEIVRRISPETSPGSGVRYETDFIYDANGNVVREDRQNKDRNGVLQPNPYYSTTMEYDILDRIVRTTEEVDASDDVVTEYGYDANRNPTLVRKGEAVNGNQPDNVVARLFDERDLPYLHVRAPGSPSESEALLDYDGNGNLVRIATHGRVSNAVYDGYDRRVESVDPMGNLTATEYDANHNVTRITVHGERLDHPGDTLNVLLSDQTRTYDALDRMETRATAHFDSAGALIGDGVRLETSVWTHTSEIQTFTDDNANTTVYVYDTLNRLATTIDALGNEERLEYDCNGNVTRAQSIEKSDLGNPDDVTAVTAAFDGLDRVASETTSLGRVTTYDYDSHHNLVATVDAEGQETLFTFDGLNRLRSTIEDMNGNGASTSDAADIVYTEAWDDSGRCIARTDPNGHVTTYAYDALDRCTSILYADGTSRSHVFDPCGNSIASTDPNGSQISRQYDELDRLRFVNITPGPGIGGTTFEAIDFDGLGRMVAAQDDDSLIQFAFDSLSNPVLETRNGVVVQAEYDGESSLVGITYPGGKVLAHQLDALNRRKSASDAHGQLYVNHFAGPLRLEGRDRANNTSTFWSFDADLRPAQVEHVFDPAGAGQVFDARAYLLDGNDNIYSEQDPIQGTNNTFIHDALDRLTQSTRSNPPETVSYDLDHGGNRTLVTGGPFPGAYVMDPNDAPVHQYTQTPMCSPVHDENGNLVSGAIGARNVVFSFDYRNQLIGSVVDGVQSSYAYDWLGRRFLNVVQGVPAGAQELAYVHYGLQVLEERDGLGNSVATYVYGEGLDDVVLMERGGAPWFLHQDINMSVTSVTDAAGSAVERYRYRDFGSALFFDGAGTPIAGSIVQNPYLFTGRRLDASGLYHLRWRYLDPSAGRFISRDPLGLWGDPVNVGNGYTFVGNAVSALGAQDPLGLRSPNSQDKRFRKKMEADTTLRRELDRFDAAVKKAKRNEKIIRLRNGTWVPANAYTEGYKTIRHLLNAMGFGEDHTLTMFGQALGPGRCNQIVKHGTTDRDFSTKRILTDLTPRTLPTLGGQYVVVKGVVWVKRRGAWRMSTLAWNGRNVVLPIHPKTGKVDLSEARRQAKGLEPREKVLNERKRVVVQPYPNANK